MISNMPLLFSVLFCAFTIYVSKAQDFASQDNPSAVPPPEAENCNGIFLSYTFVSRTKEYPHLKNATAQPWAFKSTATILNAGMNVLKKIWRGYSRGLAKRESHDMLERFDFSLLPTELQLRVRYYYGSLIELTTWSSLENGLFVLLTYSRCLLRFYQCLTEPLHFLYRY